VTNPKTLVIGGSGYLGRYIVDSLRARKHRVSVLTRSRARSASLFPRQVRLIEADLQDMDEAALARAFKGQENLVFAAGVDERVAPDGDPLAFYRRENVDRVQRVLEAAAVAGIRKATLLNSIFSTLDRLRKDVHLAEHHPYITSRVEQRDMALATARGHYTMTVLEIPWVFGDARGSESQWSTLVQFARTTPRLFVPRGGTVVISAANVGEAAAGALEYPRRSSATPVGDAWMSWEALLASLVACCGREALPVTRIPDRLLVQFNELSGLGQKLFRLKSGLDYGRMHEFLLDDQPIDLRASQKKLGYTPGDISKALAETADDVPESRAIAALRRLLD
jgi:nucleoside-diphosphate-sugar epimerase